MNVAGATVEANYHADWEHRISPPPGGGGFSGRPKSTVAHRNGERALDYGATTIGNEELKTGHVFLRSCARLEFFPVRLMLWLSHV